MEPFGDEEAAAKYMLDAINKDTRANTTEQIGEEEARTADSFLNMSRDGGEEQRSEEDDDFAPSGPTQQHVLVRISIMHGDLCRLVLRLIYLFFYIVILWIEDEPVKRETPADQKT